MPRTSKELVRRVDFIPINNVNLSGIGNGWVDPKIQYGAYAEVK